jgi:single-strand DNA-binding protein
MFNTIIISGRITHSPELKTTPNGIPVISFSIANESGYGEEKHTNFINIVAWRKTAELISKYFSKGSMIGIEGSLQARQYKDKQGNNRTAFEVVASGVQFMESKKAAEESTAAAQAADNVPEYTPESVPDFETISGDEDLPF